MSDSHLIDRRPVVLNKHQVRIVEQLYNPQLLNETIVENITYLSDGLKIKGYLAQPQQPGIYPVLIWNRGGFGDRGSLDDLTAHLILASTAQWGYVVLGTQYRGNRGSEGSEDWGGRDVNDALNLLKVADEIPSADTARVAIEGASRGGMTTYRALALEHRFRCAIVHAGITDVFELENMTDEFNRFIEKMLGHLSFDEKRQQLANRSVVYFAEKLPKNCPLLLMHGKADKRIPLSQTMALVKELDRLSLPYKLVLLENGGHVALRDGSYKEIDIHRKEWLKKYLI